MSFSRTIWNTHDGHRIQAKTENQDKLFKAIDKNKIVFASGQAGTGKTFCTVAKALELMERDGYSKLILSRPIIEAKGERLGFLPGDLGDKIAPYLQPLFDILKDLADYNQDDLPTNDIPSKKKKKKTHIDKLDLKSKVDVLPIAYMRGKTFRDAIVIIDEAQNITPHQMKLILSRLGEHSKMIFCGDTRQSDIGNDNCGLAYCVNNLKDIKKIGFIEFTKDDIVREGIIKDILEVFEKDMI